MGEMRNASKILAGKPEECRLLGRPKRRWEDYVRTNLREIGLEVLNCIYLAQDTAQNRALVDKVINLLVS
jgi:hypothetical protein